MKPMPSQPQTIKSASQSRWRALAFVLALLGLGVLYYQRLPISHVLGLASYSLVFVACLTLCRRKRRALIFTLLWFVLIAVSLLLNAKGFQLSSDVNATMTAMKLMMASTLLQNVVISLYLLSTLLLLRETSLITRLLGVLATLMLAGKIVPALGFSLGFIAGTI